MESENMVLKVAILDTNSLENKGSYGRLVGLIRALDSTLPRHELTVFHRYYGVAQKGRIDGLMKNHSNLEIREHPWYNEKGSQISTTLSFLSSLSIVALKQIVNRTLRRKSEPFEDYDILIDLNLIEPDSFSDDKIEPINLIGQLFALLSIWNTTLSGKKVVISSATIGPYKNTAIRFLAHKILNRVNLITLREAHSKEYLKAIRVIGPRIELTADLAFLMEVDGTFDPQVISKRLNLDADGGAIIGVCPAAMMNSMLDEEKYIQLMMEVSNFLIDNVGATILYIANTFQDVNLVEKIHDAVNNKKMTRIVPFSESATDVKSAIGLCDLFICSRFHALVASTSIGVPTIGLVSYSYNKFHGIIGNMMGQEEYLLDIDQTFEYSTFIETIKMKARKLLKDKKDTTQELLNNYTVIKRQALINGHLIRELEA